MSQGLEMCWDLPLLQCSLLAMVHGILALAKRWSAHLVLR